MLLAEDRALGDMQRARTAVGILDRDTELSASDTECLHAFGTPLGYPISRRGLHEGYIRARLAGYHLRMRSHGREQRCERRSVFRALRVRGAPRVHLRQFCKRQCVN